MHAETVGTAASRPAMVGLEFRLRSAEADALATRIPRLRAMLAGGVLFFRDPRDRDDLDSALAKLAAALATCSEPFDTCDWPPRPPRIGKRPGMGRRKAGDGLWPKEKS